MEFNQINDNVILWAKEKGLLKPDNAQAQTLKLFEEGGELADAVLKNNRDEQIDAIGDCLVVLNILCKQLDLDMVECYESAWNEIKDRKGKMIGNTFIKD